MKPIIILLSTILLTIFTVFSALAQENYQLGWIVPEANQDTLKGYVDYREWEINPRQIYFKSADSGQKVVYTPVNSLPLV